MEDFAPTGGQDPETVVLRPDASILSAVGRGHTLASAIADLIDNSIDAGANTVNIHFVVKNSMIRSIRISDDGCGMTRAQLTDAMTLGKRREYGEKSLGHFGVGLQGASLSQARVVSVYSASGHAPTAGMRLAKEQADSAIVADVFDADTASAILRRRGVIGPSGTLVEWTHLESVSVASTIQERRRWIETTILRVRDELGLIFHRILDDGRIRIELTELDETSDETGAPRRVKAIDPFGFDRWGANGYPRPLSFPLASGGSVVTTCYVLAPGVESGLLARSRRDAQGLYVYRNDRLLQAGGWLGLNQDLPADLQLARIAIDLTDDALAAIAINPEKRGVVFRPSAVQGLERAVTDGLTLRMFWDTCRDVWNASKRRELKARPFAQPGEGAPSALSEIFERSVGVRDDGGVELSFDWKRLEYVQLFTFDPPTGTVWLNDQHRSHLEQNEAHFASIKTSLFFLLEPHVGKERLAASTAERLDAMQAGLAMNVIPARHQQERTVVDLPLIGGDPGLPRVVIERVDFDEPLGDPRVAHVHVSSEALDDFMRRIRKTQLLEAEEEVELGSAIEAGLFAGERLMVRHGGRVTDQATLDLAFVEREGRRARDRMVVSNVRLVASIAKKYQYNGLELADLIQEGVLGLIRAIDKFDHRQGTKVSTYATWWIRQSITRALADKGRAIRLPVHLVEKLPEIQRQWAEARGGATQRLHAVARQRSESVGAIRGVINNRYEPLSLDSTVAVRVDSGSWIPVPMADVLRDNEAFGPEEWAERFDTKRRVDDLLNSLSEREELVLRKRYGTTDGMPQTLDQIGDSLGVTRERVRQIEKKAMESLRSRAEREIARQHAVVGNVANVANVAGGGDHVRQTMLVEETASVEVDAEAGASASELPPTVGDEDPALAHAVLASSEPTENSIIIDWPTMVRVFGLYSDGWGMSAIAIAIDADAWDVVAALAKCVFEVSDEAIRVFPTDEAPAVLSEPELARLKEMAEAGYGLETIAEDLGRTPLATAWSILDGPKRPRLTRRMLGVLRPRHDSGDLARASTQI